jgi:hypothetical protein
MKKIRKLSFLGILGIVICALIFIGIGYLEAQNQGKGKPDKPPKPDKPGGGEVTWAVQIPDGNMNLKGMNPEYVYINNDDDIIVSMEKKGWRTAGKGGGGIYYILLFKLVNPTNNWVKFNDVLLSYVREYPENGSSCVFPDPETCGLNTPYCMQCFLNQQQHPYSSDSVEYDHVYIKFWIWDYDIENMNPGDEYQLGSGDWTSSSNDRIRIKTGYTPVNTCSRSEPDYHDIICQKYAEDGSLNIWIERLGDKWQIYGDVYDLPVKETFCIEEKQKGWVSTTVTTLEATSDFSFMMNWIKNPQ